MYMKELGPSNPAALDENPDYTCPDYAEFPVQTFGLELMNSCYDSEKTDMNFFASHFKKRFTERSLDLVWQRVPDFGTYVVEGLYAI